MVDIDAHGNNLIDKRHREVETKLEEIYEKCGIKISSIFA